MRLKDRERILGGAPPDKRQFLVIPAGERREFFFEFSKDDFAVKNSQRLRVVVDAWADEQAMRARERVIKLTTPAFECP